MNVSIEIRHEMFNNEWHADIIFSDSRIHYYACDSLDDLMKIITKAILFDRHG